MSTSLDLAEVAEQILTNNLGVNAYDLIDAIASALHWQPNSGIDRALAAFAKQGMDEQEAQAAYLADPIYASATSTADSSQIDFLDAATYNPAWQTSDGVFHNGPDRFCMGSDKTLLPQLPFCGFKVSKTGSNQTIPVSGSGAQLVTFDDASASNGNFNYGTWFNTSTSRFTPKKAGYYLFSARLHSTGAWASGGFLYLKKNGTWYHDGTDFGALASNSSDIILPAQVVYLNGTTDYVELWINNNSASTPYTITAYQSGGRTVTWFQGSLISPY